MSDEVVSWRYLNRSSQSAATILSQLLELQGGVVRELRGVTHDPSGTPRAERFLRGVDILFHREKPRLAPLTEATETSPRN